MPHQEWSPRERHNGLAITLVGGSSNGRRTLRATTMVAILQIVLCGGSGVGAWHGVVHLSVSGLGNGHSARRSADERPSLGSFASSSCLEQAPAEQKILKGSKLCSTSSQGPSCKKSRHLTCACGVCVDPAPSQHATSAPVTAGNGRMTSLLIKMSIVTGSSHFERRMINVLIS